MRTFFHRLMFSSVIRVLFVHYCYPLPPPFLPLVPCHHGDRADWLDVTKVQTSRNKIWQQMFTRLSEENGERSKTQLLWLIYIYCAENSLQKLLNGHDGGQVMTSNTNRGKKSRHIFTTIKHRSSPFFSTALQAKYLIEACSQHTGLQIWGLWPCPLNRWCPDRDRWGVKPREPIRNGDDNTRPVGLYGHSCLNCCCPLEALFDRTKVQS